MVVEEVDENLYLGARNIRQVDVTDVQGVNPVNLIGYEKVLFTVGALKRKLRRCWDECGCNIQRHFRRAHFREGYDCCRAVESVRLQGPTRQQPGPEIKAAVEKIYGVSVAGVTVANVKGKDKENHARS